MSEYAKKDDGEGLDELQGQPAPDGDVGEGEGGEGGKPEKKAAKPSDEVKLSKKEYEALQKRVAEADETAQYWAERAKPPEKAEKPEDEEKAADEPEDDGDVDKFVTDLTKSGLKALVNRGVLTKKEATEIIQREARKVTKELVAAEVKRVSTDAELVRQFPDLQNRESEHFKRTSSIYREMVEQDETLKRSPQALFLAARAAKAELAAEKPKGDSGRDARIRAQAGDRGGGRSHEEGDDDTSLGPEAQAVIAAFKIDEKGYRRHMERSR